MFRTGDPDPLDACCLECEIAPAQIHVEVAVLDRQLTVEDTVRLESGVEACLTRSAQGRSGKPEISRWNTGMAWTLSGPLAELELLEPKLTGVLVTMLNAVGRGRVKREANLAMDRGGPFDALVAADIEPATMEITVLAGGQPFTADEVEDLGRLVATALAPNGLSAREMRSPGGEGAMWRVSGDRRHLEEMRLATAQRLASILSDRGRLRIEYGRELALALGPA